MISKEEFESYESIRQSGVTNMFMVKTVVELSGLKKEKVLEIMEGYTELKEKFAGEKED